MGLFDTEALVLRTYNLAEADKIVVCLTRDAGLIRAVAKGSRKLKNRFGAALEPFTLLNISCFQKEHQELISLRNVEILQSNFSVFGDPDILTALAYMGDLIIDFSPPYQSNEKLFRMVKACLEAIAESPSDLQALVGYFEVWLLRLEGFMPDLKSCAECHRAVTDGEPLYLGSDLTVRCELCNGGRGFSLSRKLYAQLKATSKLAPRVFAQEARNVPVAAQREMAEFTQRLIGRVLERQPRVKLSFN
jgi:DNA repair protein RecO (recombination protein O)